MKHTKIDNRIIKELIIFSLLILLFAPLSASATSTTGLVPCGGPDEEPCTACDLLVLFQNVLKFALEIAFLIVIGFIVYGGFRWIFSLGKEENLKAGQKIITNAIIGIVIILSAWIIVNTVFWVIKQMGGDDYTGTWFHIDCSELSGWLKDSVAPAETPTEAPTETPAEPVSKCFDCGDGIWNVCDEKECLSLGDCYFSPSTLLVWTPGCYPNSK